MTENEDYSSEPGYIEKVIIINFGKLHPGLSRRNRKIIYENRISIKIRFQTVWKQRCLKSIFIGVVEIGCTVLQVTDFPLTHLHLIFRS